MGLLVRTYVGASVGLYDGTRVGNALGATVGIRGALVGVKDGISV